MKKCRVISHDHCLYSYYSFTQLPHERLVLQDEKLKLCALKCLEEMDRENRV